MEEQGNKQMSTIEPYPIGNTPPPVDNPCLSLSEIDVLDRTRSQSFVLTQTSTNLRQEIHFKHLKKDVDHPQYYIRRYTILNSTLSGAPISFSAQSAVTPYNTPYTLTFLPRFLFPSQ